MKKNILLQKENKHTFNRIQQLSNKLNLFIFLSFLRYLHTYRGMFSKHSIVLYSCEYIWSILIIPLHFQLSGQICGIDLHCRRPGIELRDLLE